MKSKKFLLVCMMVFVCSALLALDFMDSIKKHTPSEPAGQSSSSQQQAATSGKTEGAVESESATSSSTGYVRVNTSLNVRTEPWGPIIGGLGNGTEVNIIGKEGSWYKISLKGQTRYVHSRYISSSPGSTSAPSTTSSAASTATGSVQRRIVDASNELVRRYSARGSFPYAPATQGGVLGCAQVVNQALQNAGLDVPMDLSVNGTDRNLKNRGWRQTSVPPYMAGDVIIWNPSHIGIIMENGNSVQAMSNSSSRRSPRTHRHDYMQIRHVLRRA